MGHRNRRVHPGRTGRAPGHPRRAGQHTPGNPTLHHQRSDLEARHPGPVIQFAAFADALEAVGVAPDGTTYYSTDAGASWTKKGRTNTEVLALTANRDEHGKPKIWAATGNEIIVSTDAGTTFQPADAG